MQDKEKEARRALRRTLVRGAGGTTHVWGWRKRGRVYGSWHLSRSVKTVMM